MADLSEDDKVATLASVTGEEDLAYCRRLLEAHGFDLEAAVNTAIGEGFRDGDRAADGARMMGDASHATTATGYSGPGSRPPTDSAHRRVLQGGAGVAPINPLLALPITVVNRSLGIVFTVIGFGFKVRVSLHRCCSGAVTVDRSVSEGNPPKTAPPLPQLPVPQLFTTVPLPSMHFVCVNRFVQFLSRAVSSSRVIDYLAPRRALIFPHPLSSRQLSRLSFPFLVVVALCQAGGRLHPAPLAAPWHGAPRAHPTSCRGRPDR